MVYLLLVLFLLMSPILQLHLSLLKDLRPQVLGFEQLSPEAGLGWLCKVFALRLSQVGHREGFGPRVAMDHLNWEDPFEVKRRGSSVTTEVRAGVATFLSMAYILPVSLRPAFSALLTSVHHLLAFLDCQNGLGESQNDSFTSKSTVHNKEQWDVKSGGAWASPRSGMCNSFGFLLWLLVNGHSIELPLHVGTWHGYECLLHFQPMPLDLRTS